MLLHFTKMEGCGNDYIYVNGFTEKVPDEKKEELAVRLSDRHFGIGSDGMIYINPSDIAEFEMEMYNADGSRGRMCGNGIRCVGKYVYDHGMTQGDKVSIESFGAVKYLEMQVENGKAVSATVNMGAPVLDPEEIPVKCRGNMCVDQPIDVGGRMYRMTCVSMGNPHAVVFIRDTEHLDIEKIGPLFESHERFPERVNTEFVEILDRRHINMRVYERGSGETLACGTGSCAAAVACILNGLTDDTVEVNVLGGILKVHWDRKENLVYLSGPMEEVFTGAVEI